MEDLKALTECAECTWDYIDRLRMALASACKERDEARKELHEAKSELDKYRKAEQDGRLVMLPCKAGDHVWVDGREAVVENFFGYETERYLHAQFYDNMQYIDIPFAEIGKTVFLTREEADAALAQKGDSE